MLQNFYENTRTHGSHLELVAAPFYKIFILTPFPCRLIRMATLNRHALRVLLASKPIKYSVSSYCIHSVYALQKCNNRTNQRSAKHQTSSDQTKTNRPVTMPFQRWGNGVRMKIL
jgi:hypothetical protein